MKSTKTKTATTAKETVKKAAVSAKKAAEPVVEETVKAAETAKKVVEPVVEETVKAAAETVKKAAAKRTTRKTAVKEAVYLQYLGKDINSADVLEAAKKASGVETVKSVTVYLKPEENKAYYVVNEDVTGSVEL